MDFGSDQWLIRFQSLVSLQTVQGTVRLVKVRPDWILIFSKEIVFRADGDALAESCILEENELWEWERMRDRERERMRGRERMRDRERMRGTEREWEGQRENER